MAVKTKVQTMIQVREMSKPTDTKKSHKARDIQEKFKRESQEEAVVVLNS